MPKIHKTQVIGRGAFSIVYLEKVLIDEVEKQVAIKKISKLDKKEMPYQVLREINVLRMISHTNIIKLLRITTNKTSLDLYLEYGGINLSVHKKKLNYEARVQSMKNIAYQIICGVSYLHDNKIIHRDLKLDNILINPATNVVKVCDFNVAKKVIINKRNSFQLGTPVYRAPELYHNDYYDTSVDVWSIGCLLYEYIIDKKLFGGSTNIVILRNILMQIPVNKNDLLKLNLTEAEMEVYNKDNYFKLPELYNDNETNYEIIKDMQLFKDLIQKMLCLNPINRISLSEAMIHDYFGSLSDDYVCEEISINSEIYARGKLLIPEEIRYTYLLDIFNIPEFYKISKRTMLLAIDIFDEYINSGSYNFKADPEQLALISRCAVSIASKYIDIKPLFLHNFKLLDSTKKLITFEKKILETINYNLTRKNIADIFYEMYPNKQISLNLWENIKKFMLDYESLSKTTHDQLNHLIVCWNTLSV